jgi:hypothetical protein
MFVLWIVDQQQRKANKTVVNYNKLESDAVDTITTKEFGIMDGGIVDNQAIDGFLKEAERGNGTNQYDLLISCDVSSYFLDAYTLPKEKKDKVSWWKRQKEKIIISLAKNFVIKKLENPKGTWAITFAKYIDIFLALPNKKLILMLETRAKSVFMLANDLYLKQIRRMYQKYMYSHPVYKDKFILNTIYDLCKANPNLPTNPVLIPSAAIMETAEKARTMSTTIWFDEQHQKDKVLEAIIATGQFTTCYNLLKYIGKLPTKTNEILALEQLLLSDYGKFKGNAFWMV